VAEHDALYTRLVGATRTGERPCGSARQ
jgi:hypothetical protein